MIFPIGPSVKTGCVGATPQLCFPHNIAIPSVMIPSAAVVAVTRLTPSAGVVDTLKVLRPVAPEDIAGLEGGTVGAEILGPADGRPVAVAAGPDLVVPAQATFATLVGVVRMGAALVVPGVVLGVVAAVGQEVVRVPARGRPAGHTAKAVPATTLPPAPILAKAGVADLAIRVVGAVLLLSTRVAPD